MIIKFKDETTCEVLKVVNNIIPDPECEYCEIIEIFFKLDDERSIAELYELFKSKDLSEFAAVSVDGETREYVNFNEIETVADTFNDSFHTKVLRMLK